MKHWMFSCKKVSEKISASMETPLPSNQKVLIWMHLLMCRYCFRFYRQLHLMRHICQQDNPSQLNADMSLSPEAVKRIKKAIKDFDK